MLAKFKLNRIEVLISKSVIDSNVSHDEFVSINNVLKEYEQMKEKIKNLTTFSKFIKDFSLFLRQLYHVTWSPEKIQKIKIQKSQDQKTEE